MHLSLLPTLIKTSMMLSSKNVCVWVSLLLCDQSHKVSCWWCHMCCTCRVTAGGTTAVKDQGLCGSCVAFATTALAEFMHMRKYGTTNTTTDLSEQVRPAGTAAAAAGTLV
jgi:C1A family cysteine protease